MFTSEFGASALRNSSAIFLSIKFAHRWSSPGALKVQDEKIEVTACCFNFSASGDHSQLRKRYAPLGQKTPHNSR